MGRMLPVECRHGVVVDWGDFGPHQNGCPASCIVDNCPDTPGCEMCEEEDGAAGWVMVRQAMLRCVVETGFAAATATSTTFAVLVGAWWCAPVWAITAWLTRLARVDYLTATTPPGLHRMLGGG